MSLKQLLAGIVTMDSNIQCLVQGLENDSRRVSRGDAFIAYKGLNVDGRDYIKEVLDQGVAAVIYEADTQEATVHFQKKIPCIAVPHLQQQIGRIAARFYGDPSKSMTVIGFTGTNGKTSCTQFVAQALENDNIRCGVLGTLGNGFLSDLKKTTHTTLCPIQLQKTLAALRDQGATVVALEASSHALHQHRLQGVHFAIAALTHLSRDHLDYHGDMESYAQAKELLFQYPGLKHAIINYDDAFGKKLIKKYSSTLNIIGYSTDCKQHKKAAVPMVLAERITRQAEGFAVNVQTPWGEGAFTTKLLGTFNLSNVLAVLCVLQVLQIPLARALSSLSQLKTVPGRMESFGGGEQPRVIVDYAHSPDALEKTLSELRRHCEGKLYCVFGCGGERDRGKRPMMSAAVERYADVIIMTNDNPRRESPQQIIQDMQQGLTYPAQATIELDRSRAIQYAVHQAASHDIVFVAGKGHETTQMIQDQAWPFNDGEEVKRALATYGNKKR